MSWLGADGRTLRDRCGNDAVGSVAAARTAAVYSGRSFTGSMSEKRGVVGARAARRTDGVYRERKSSHGRRRAAISPAAAVPVTAGPPSAPRPGRSPARRCEVPTGARRHRPAGYPKQTPPPLTPPRSASTPCLVIVVVCQAPLARPTRASRTDDRTAPVVMRMPP